MKIFCDGCGVEVDSDHKTWWQKVPGIGNLCGECHRLWSEAKRAEFVDFAHSLPDPDGLVATDEECV